MLCASFAQLRPQQSRSSEQSSPAGVHVPAVGWHIALVQRPEQQSMSLLHDAPRVVQLFAPEHCAPPSSPKATHASEQHAEASVQGSSFAASMQLPPPAELLDETAAPAEPPALELDAERSLPESTSTRCVHALIRAQASRTDRPVVMAPPRARRGSALR